MYADCSIVGIDRVCACRSGWEGDGQLCEGKISEQPIITRLLKAIFIKVLFVNTGCPKVYAVGLLCF